MREGKEGRRRGKSKNGRKGGKREAESERFLVNGKNLSYVCI